MSEEKCFWSYQDDNDHLCHTTQKEAFEEFMEEEVDPENGDLDNETLTLYQFRPVVFCKTTFIKELRDMINSHFYDYMYCEDDSSITIPQSTEKAMTALAESLSEIPTQLCDCVEEVTKTVGEWKQEFNWSKK